MGEKGLVVAFEGPGLPFTEQFKVVPGPGNREILVKNLYTTICGSDLHTYCGVRKESCPSVLGHEIVGEIISFGAGHDHKDFEGTNLQIGDRVTWSVFSGNPESELAKQGMPQKSDGLFKYGHAMITEEEAFHGGLAAYCLLKKGTGVLKIAEEVPLPIAATINCAIATVAGALRLSGSVAGKSVLITGMGLLGVVCVAMCHQAGARSIVAADINEDRLAMARDFGATHAINLTEAGSLNNAVDISFDMSGAPEAMELGLSQLFVGGTAVWIGAVFNTRAVQVNPEQLIRRILTIKGLHNYNFQDLVTARDFTEANWNRYPFNKIVSKEFPISAAQDAFEYALAHKPLRVGVRI